MQDAALILGFLQAITILIAAFALKKLWDNSIQLTKIATKLDAMCRQVNDHEERLRTIQNHPAPPAVRHG